MVACSQAVANGRLLGGSVGSCTASRPQRAWLLQCPQNPGQLDSRRPLERQQPPVCIVAAFARLLSFWGLSDVKQNNICSDGCSLARNASKPLMLSTMSWRMLPQVHRALRQGEMAGEKLRADHHEKKPAASGPQHNESIWILGTSSVPAILTGAAIRDSVLTAPRRRR